MKNLKLLAFLIPILMLNSCTQSVKSQSGQVIDSVVEGLEYQCAGFVKYTDSNGTISCEHTPIGFKVGNIKIGYIKKVPSDGYVLPQDIAKVSRNNLENEYVKKIVVLLQSLDEDLNPENGIKITPETREKLDIFIDLENTNIEEVKELIEAQLDRSNLKDESEAIEHLKSSMRKYNISY